MKNKGTVVGLCVVIFFALIAIFAPALAPHNALQIFPNNSDRQAAWVSVPENPTKTGDWNFPLGTDTIGRDVLSRALYGARISMIVGFIPTTIVVLVGTLIGLIAGFAGGKVDDLLMRFTDIIFAFPDFMTIPLTNQSFYPSVI